MTRENIMILITHKWHVIERDLWYMFLLVTVENSAENLNTHNQF